MAQEMMTRRALNRALLARQLLQVVELIFSNADPDGNKVEVIHWFCRWDDWSEVELGVPDNAGRMLLTKAVGSGPHCGSCPPGRLAVRAVIEWPAYNRHPVDGKGINAVDPLSVKQGSSKYLPANG